MISAGIDVGARTTKAVLCRDGQMLARSLVATGFEQLEAVEEALTEALRAAGIPRGEIAYVVATGAGRKAVPFAQRQVTEVMADARGTVALFPTVRTILDVGAEEARAIRCQPEGKVVDFAGNEKCAAGAGAFVEAMARALEVKLEEMGPLSLLSTQTIPINSQCTIFAESEVVSLIHARTPKQDIVRSIHESIADRLISMTRRVGIEPAVAFIGGGAKNVGLIDCLKRGMEVDLLVPDEPEFIGALGAALIAAEG